MKYHNNNNSFSFSFAPGDISIVELLGVTFVILKLRNTIDWPWLWVLSPFWIPRQLPSLFSSS